MKKLLSCLFVLASLSAHANFELSWERNSPGGSESYKLTEQGGKYVIAKNSNWTAQGDLRVGTFNPVVTSEFQKAITELKVLHQGILDTEAQLQRVGMGVNKEEQKKDLHEPRFVLNGTVIKNTSGMYEEIRKRVQVIQKAELTLVEGAALSPGQKKIFYYTDGKVSGEEPFKMDFFCSEATPPTECKLRKWGIVKLNSATKQL